MNTFLPTTNGKDVDVENPVVNWIVTSLVTVLNPTVLIPTPLGLLTVMMLGATSERFLAFSLILILETEPFLTSAWRTTFSTFLLVSASITTKPGSILYPLPPEEIPTLSKEFNSSILRISGTLVTTLRVGSDG